MAKKKSNKAKPGPFEWPGFLQQVSADLLRDESIYEDLPDEVIDSGWMGYEGASEAQIVALEKRIGRTLPPSYRTFLAASNGWRNCGAFIYELLPSTEVRWFCEQNQDWIDAYVHPENSGVEVEVPAGHTPPPPLTDEEYLVYGEQQDPRMRVEYLQTALEISAVGDSAIVLLNPEIINAEAEWEAWLFANWIPGAHRYPSFRDLMQAEHATYCRLEEEQGPSKSKYGNSAQQAARRGQTTAAIAGLRLLVEKGDLLSALSLAELCAFRGLWSEVIPNLGRLLLDLGAVQNFEGYPTDLLRLLARAGHETGEWKQIAKLARAGVAAEKAREYDQYHEHVRNAHVTWFKNLEKYCKREGAPPHELISVFGDDDPIDAMSEAERRTRYETAVKEQRPRYKNKAKEFQAYRFSVANVFRLDDEVLRIYEEAPQDICFKDGLAVARAYLRSGNHDAAWEVIRARVNQSATNLPEQVAPIILLVDETLRPLMTPERCEVVLSTPRGRESLET